MVRYEISCTAPRAAAALPSGADTKTACSAAGSAEPSRTAPTAWAAQSSAKPSDSGARCSADRRNSRGRDEGETGRVEGFEVMNQGKGGPHGARGANCAHCSLARSAACLGARGGGAQRGVSNGTDVNAQRPDMLTKKGELIGTRPSRLLPRRRPVCRQAPAHALRDAAYSKRPVRAISISLAIRSSVDG